MNQILDSWLDQVKLQRTEKQSHSKFKGKRKCAISRDQFCGTTLLENVFVI